MDQIWYADNYQDVVNVFKAKFYNEKYENLLFERKITDKCL